MLLFLSKYKNTDNNYAAIRTTNDKKGIMSKQLLTNRRFVSAEGPQSKIEMRETTAELQPCHKTRERLFTL